jgi:peptidoglycan/xylan/chitin deacetylase (PgdA/CDA1 family)/SAM-dependent methyltransferase
MSPLAASPPESLLDLERALVDAQDRHEALERELQQRREELRAVGTETEAAARAWHGAGRQRVEMGDLRRLAPLSPLWGTDRGLPIDRHYIHAFLHHHRADIAGHVLEIKDDGYARHFGGAAVSRVDVLDVDRHNPRATVIADLAHADALAADTYDCFILTQTLGVIYDVAGALRHAVRVLKPGGVLLCTLPAAGRISHEEGLDGDYWRFTEGSVRRLFGEVLTADAFDVEGHGNVLTGAAFLYGLAAHELTAAELDATDPYLPLVYTVRAVKPLAGSGTHDAGSSNRTGHARPRATSTPSAAVLAYHRIGQPAHPWDALAVTAEAFTAQLDLLRSHGIDVLPLRGLVDEVRSGELQRPAVALTFDDGYADALHAAAPILESFGFPATFFVVGATLDAPVEFWWDVLDAALLADSSTPPRLVLAFPGDTMTLSTATLDERRRARHVVAERLYDLDHDRRSDVLTQLREWASPRRIEPTHPTMTADEVVQLARRPGMTIGAHTMQHDALTVLPYPARVDDLRRCRARLETLLGVGVTTLSYPYGRTDDRTVEAAREAGFTVAVTTEERPLSATTTTRLVPRLDPGRAASDLRTALSSQLSYAEAGTLRP